MVGVVFAELAVLAGGKRKPEQDRRIGKRRNDLVLLDILRIKTDFAGSSFRSRSSRRRLICILLSVRTGVGLVYFRFIVYRSTACRTEFLSFFDLSAAISTKSHK